MLRSFMIWLLLGAWAFGKPNVVVVLLDDMGFSDVGCYGGEIETPNLDGLAAGGVRFSDFHNTGRCCPTRASLLTGLYPHQAGVGWMTADWKKPGYRGFLNRESATLGEVLGASGYFTVMTGKWHVGSKDGRRPAQRGFERSYCIPEGGGFYFQVRKGRSVRKNDVVVASGDADGEKLPEGWYSTDAFVDEGLKFVGEAVAAGRPFFWYLAPNAPHFPLQAPQETIEKYRGRYREGWDLVRERRYSAQLESALFPEPWERSPRDPKVPAWSSLSEAQKDASDLIMATYAAVMEHLDRSVGVLVEGLKAKGVYEDTLILFLSDNGGCAEGGMLGKTGEGVVGSAESSVYCGKAWANAQDTPFRFYKKWVHEGGTSTPLIAHWPAGIERPGRTDHTAGHVIDLMATLVEVTGSAYPEGVQAMEGVSLVPVLKDGEVEREGMLYWEHEGHRAVRDGRWKLVAVHGKDWELYDLEKDRTELNDLAGAMPEKVAVLEKAYLAWAERARVEPWDSKRKLW